MRYKAVLFDLDGTLVDTKPGIINSVKATFRRLNIAPPPEETLNHFMGPPVFRSFTDVCGLSEALAGEAVRIYRSEIVESGEVFNCSLYEGMTGLLAELKSKGIKLGVATSKPEHLAVMLLGHLGAARFFEAICGAPVASRIDSKADSIRHALALIPGAEKGSAVLVGDRCFDALGAQETGIDSIGVLYGYGNRQEIESSPFTYTARSIAETRKILLA
jgi:phosphoglycolate phosphatase